MLRLMLAKVAAMLPMSRLMLAKEAALLLAAVDAGGGGCDAACRGVRWRRNLRCCMLRGVQTKEAALLFAVVGLGEGGCAAAC